MGSLFYNGLDGSPTGATAEAPGEWDDHAQTPTQDEAEEIMMDCTPAAREIFTEKIEGSLVKILHNTVEFASVTKFQGHVRFRRRYDATVGLEYDISFQVRLDVTAGRQSFVGMLSLDSVRDSSLSNCDTLGVQWVGARVPAGYSHQQCESLVKASKVRRCLVGLLCRFEEACVETFSRRFGWELVLPETELPPSANQRRHSKSSMASEYNHLNHDENPGQDKPGANPSDS